MNRTLFPLLARLALLVSLAPMALPAWAEATEAELKAAFVFNFTKFVEWPAESLAATPGSLNVCLLGPRNAFFDALHELNGKPVKNHNLNVRSLGRGESPRQCQVLVLGESEAELFESVLKRIEGLAVLTIGGAGRFFDAGGIIGLVTEDGKVRFDVNLVAARRSNLELSSNLLRLARQVRKP